MSTHDDIEQQIEDVSQYARENPNGECQCDDHGSDLCAVHGGTEFQLLQRANQQITQLQAELATAQARVDREQELKLQMFELKRKVEAENDALRAESARWERECGEVKQGYALKCVQLNNELTRWQKMRKAVKNKRLQEDCGFDAGVNAALDAIDEVEGSDISDTEPEGFTVSMAIIKDQRTGEMKLVQGPTLSDTELSPVANTQSRFYRHVEIGSDGEPHEVPTPSPVACSECARWKKAIEGLTPSGSEYVNDPDRCAEFIRHRTQYPRQIVELRAECERLRIFETAIAMCGLPAKWEEDDERMHYVTIQIDKEDWQACRAALTSKPTEPKPLVQTTEEKRRTALESAEDAHGR